MNEPCDSCVLRDLCRHRGPNGRATSQAAGNLGLTPQCTDRGGRVVALRSGQATALLTRFWMRPRIAVEAITKVTAGVPLVMLEMSSRAVVASLVHS